MTIRDRLMQFNNAEIERGNPPSIQELAEHAQRLHLEVVADLLAEVMTLRDERALLLDAIDCLIIGACTVGVPHPGERAVLQSAVAMAREAVAGVRAGEQRNEGDE